MGSDRLILGIDGGGTKTVAWLALPSSDAKPEILGRGTAGPVNPQSVDWATVTENLDQVVRAAMDDAAVEPGAVASAVLASAGSDRDENRKMFRAWAEKRGIARSFHVVHDALPVLVAGTPECWGVALIAGTGSLAFGRTGDGQTARAGGWGYLFGDEGSGYAIALAGLRAVARAADGRGPPTRLVDALLGRLGLQRPADLVPGVYGVASDRGRIASLAEVVVQVADEGDAVADQIVDQAASDLAAMVGAVACNLSFEARAFPLAVSGSVLLGNERLRDNVGVHLASAGHGPSSSTCVFEPVLGAVLLAEAEVAGRTSREIPGFFAN